MSETLEEEKVEELTLENIPQEEPIIEQEEPILDKQEPVNIIIEESPIDNNQSQIRCKKLKKK